MDSPLSQQDYISTFPLFPNIRNSIDLVLTKPLCDLWPRKLSDGIQADL